jgi:hypothetical protein
MFCHRLRNFILLVGCSALMLVGCDAIPSVDQQYSDATNLKLTFPAIERLQLVEYGTGAQELFHYRRGTFSKSGRTYFDGETGSTKFFPAFDAQAQQDLAMLEDAIAQSGVRVSGISGTRYDAKGHLMQAEFNLPANSAPLSYVYSPSYGEVPATHGQRITRINSDWYLLQDDWN